MDLPAFSVMVSPLKAHEQEQFVSLMGKYHYLGWRGGRWGADFVYPLIAQVFKIERIREIVKNKSFLSK